MQTSEPLTSWKAIASYLGCDERTAQRWESECGLPVHRTPGRKRGSVFAFKHELDAWLRQTESGNNPNDRKPDDLLVQPSAIPADSRMPVGATPEPTEKHSLVIQFLVKSKKRLLAFSVFLLVLLGIFGAFLIHSRAGMDSRAPHLSKLTEDGHFKLNLRTDGKTLYFNEFEGAHEILISVSTNGGPAHPILTSLSNVDLQDVSNDGQNLLVTSFEGIEEEKPLWVVPVSGGTPRRVGDILCHSARWSPDNRKIACAVRTTIMVMNADASDAFTLASFPLRPTRLIWSPDGKRLRLVLENDQTKELLPEEIGIANGGATASPVSLKASLGPNCCADWDWTAGNKRFAYATVDGGQTTSIFITSADRSFMSRTTKVPFDIGYTLSLTGGKRENVVYALIENVANGNSYQGELFKFDPQRKTFHTVLHGLSASYLSFSKDGQWMTYLSNRDNSLWRSRVDGTEALQLTKPPLETVMSSWSPDGRRIAFMGKQPGKLWRIYLIDRDGGVMEEAGSGSDNQGAPSWSPDGKTLVYGNVLCSDGSGCWIRRINLATKSEEILPDSHGFRTARWSPDGKYIAALQQDNHQLMLFDIAQKRWTTLAGSIMGDNLNWSSDSQYIYADSPHGENPIIERIRTADGKRETVASLSTLQKTIGQADFWFGLAPDGSPILGHRLIGSEVYVLNWADQ